MVKLEQHWVNDPNYYLPDIDYNRFEGIDRAYDWVNERKDNPLVLFCNGPANSGQSRAGDLIKTIDILSAQYPETNFLLTQKTHLQKPNIYYTDDIFDGIDSDLNQIAYIAGGCDLIVGKNSGPFSFCQNKNNLLDSDITFLNLSVKPTDCPSGGGLYRARCVYTAEIEESRLAAMISVILTNPEFRGTEIIS